MNNPKSSLTIFSVSLTKRRHVWGCFSGFVDLDTGVNSFGVPSGVGFEPLIDGDVVADFNSNRGFNSTPTADRFDAGATGGVFAFELLLRDGSGGATDLRTTLNSNVFGMEDFAEAPAAVPLSAGLPRLAAGLARLGLVARRRRG